jgi:hypothetical protein
MSHLIYFLSLNRLQVWRKQTKEILTTYLFSLSYNRCYKHPPYSQAHNSALCEKNICNHSHIPGVSFISTINCWIQWHSSSLVLTVPWFLNIPTEKTERIQVRLLWRLGNWSFMSTINSAPWIIFRQPLTHFITVVVVKHHCAETTREDVYWRTHLASVHLSASMKIKLIAATNLYQENMRVYEASNGSLWPPHHTNKIIVWKWEYQTMSDFNFTLLLKEK